MEPADALSWLVGLSAAVGLVTSVRQLGLLARGWVLVQSLVLAAAVAALAFGKPELAYAAAAGWVLFVYGPRLAQQRAQGRFAELDFDAAARWARIAAVLHPFDGAQDQAKLILAQGEAIRGRTERARALLAELERSPRLRQFVELELLRLDGDWRAIVEHLDAEPRAAFDPMLAMPYLRALGETGDTSRLLTTYEKLPVFIRRLAHVRLVVVAFSARPELAEALFDGPLARDPPLSRSYWLAVAEQASGDSAAAAQRLGALISADVLAAQAKKRLLSPAPLVSGATLSPEARRVLDALAREIREVRALPGPRTASRPPFATLALMGVLAVVFVVGKMRNENYTDALEELGALVLPPERAGGGAWWRVVTAGFLHVNATHLAMNLFGLWVLGRAVERGFGPLPMFVAFFASSVGAYTTGLFFMPATAEHPAIALGASAGVFGLVGALGSYAAVGFLRRRNRWFGRQLVGMVLVVGIQLVFDAFHPGVSSFLHLAGAAWGAALAVPFAFRRFENPRAVGA